MRRRENEPDMPPIAVEKICFVASSSRRLMAEEPGSETDASNPTDDRSLITLTEASDAPMRQEVREFIRSLDSEELDGLVAMAWIGRGDFEPENWPAAMVEAQTRRTGDTADYLLGLPLLPDYLEAALSAFDRSCQEFEPRDVDQG